MRFYPHLQANKLDSYNCLDAGKKLWNQRQRHLFCTDQQTEWASAYLHQFCLPSSLPEWHNGPRWILPVQWVYNPPEKPRNPVLLEQEAHIVARSKQTSPSSPLGEVIQQIQCSHLDQLIPHRNRSVSRMGKPCIWYTYQELAGMLGDSTTYTVFAVWHWVYLTWQSFWPAYLGLMLPNPVLTSHCHCIFAREISREWDKSMHTLGYQPPKSWPGLNHVEHYLACVLRHAVLM